MTTRQNNKTGLYNQKLYRFVRSVTNWQLHSRIRHHNNGGGSKLVFAIVLGALTLGTITAAAYLTKLPLLFPPLAPSAFILFTKPMSDQAAPRNVLMSHALAVVSGMAALAIASLFFPDAGLHNTVTVTGPRILAISLAMALVTTAMMAFKCSHPPAAASALLAAMGYLDGIVPAVALVAAAAMLVLEATILLRIGGGLPYPLWSADPRLIRQYGDLAGQGFCHRTQWNDIHDKILSDITWNADQHHDIEEKEMSDAHLLSDRAEPILRGPKIKETL